MNKIEDFSNLKAIEIYNNERLTDLTNCIVSMKILCGDKIFEIPSVFFKNGINGGLYVHEEDHDKYTDRYCYIKLEINGMLLSTINGYFETQS